MILHASTLKGSSSGVNFVLNSVFITIWIHIMSLTEVKVRLTFQLDFSKISCTNYRCKIS